MIGNGKGLERFSAEVVVAEGSRSLRHSERQGNKQKFTGHGTCPEFLEQWWVLYLQDFFFMESPIPVE